MASPTLDMLAMVQLAYVVYVREILGQARGAMEAARQLEARCRAEPDVARRCRQRSWLTDQNRISTLGFDLVVARLKGGAHA